MRYWLLAGAAIVLGIYFIFDPQAAGFFPKCPFNQLTGMDCPGCGSQRAIHALLHFDIPKAFRFNPLLVISLPYIFLGYIFEFSQLANKWPKIRKFLFGPKAIWMWAIVVVLFWVGRNL
jgi:Protein of unknown function (DUF2752)